MSGTMLTPGLPEDAMSGGCPRGLLILQCPHRAAQRLDFSRTRGPGKLPGYYYRGLGSVVSAFGSWYSRLLHPL